MGNSDNHNGEHPAGGDGPWTYVPGPAQGNEPELSRVYHLRTLPAGEVEITASPEERAALAARFGLRAVNRLSANLTLTGGEKHEVNVDGQFRADIIQACAVSGEDLLMSIAEDVTLRFVPADEHAPEGEDEIALDADDCDEIPYSGDSFDLGEALAQSLALAIDPYAEGPEAERVRRDLGLEERAPDSPFAALAQLQQKPGANNPIDQDPAKDS